MSVRKLPQYGVYGNFICLGPQSETPRRNDRAGKPGGSAIAEEGLEAVVHVGLDVAVEEGQAGLVGGELDGGAAVQGDDYRIFDDAGGELAVDIDEFPLVAVEMQIGRASCRERV